MNKLNLTCLIFTIIGFFISITALVLGVLAITDKNDTKITGAYAIGLGDLLENEVIQMTYIGTQPDHIVDFMDMEILGNLREALRLTTFQKTKLTLKKIYREIGSGPDVFINIKTSKSLYSIASSGTINIIIDGEANSYNSNMSYVVWRIIDQAYDKLFK